MFDVRNLKIKPASSLAKPDLASRDNVSIKPLYANI